MVNKYCRFIFELIIIIKIVYRFNVSRNENFVLITLKGGILVIRVDDIDVKCRSG